MKEFVEKVKKAIEDFEEITYQSTVIIIINSEIFLRYIDLNEFHNNIIFICHSLAEKDKVLVLQDSPAKRAWYAFSYEYPEMVFRGKKGGVKDECEPN